MTAKRIAANQANGRRSHGPATPEGRERIRAANTRHGFYSQAEAVALTCLGEDPAELERLRNDLQGDLQPLSALEKELKEHLVEVVWRWKRAGRGQEGFALRLAKDANLTREDRLHAQMMRLKITADTLRRLAQSVAREPYVTPREDLEIMKSLHQEGAVREIGEIALALFCQLRKPGTDEDGLDPEESARRVVAQVKAIFGIGMRAEFAPQASIAADSSQPQDCQQVRIQDSDGVHRTSEIEAAGATEADVAPASSRPEGGRRDAGTTLETQQDAGAAEAEEDAPDDMSPEEEAHERARQLLENILKRQVELCEAQRQAILKDSLTGPSPYERAAEIALAHPDTALMQRMEESSFRQIWRIATLLLKIKRQAREEKSREMPPRTREVYERKAG